MSRSLSSITIHLIFSTKERRAFITAEIERDLFTFLATVLKDNGCTPLAIGGYLNHVHLLFNLQRTKTIAELVEDLKVRSTKWLKQTSPACKIFQWQNGYAAFSVGAAQRPVLVNYIAKQAEHHQKRSFDDELQTILRRYETPFHKRDLLD